MANNTNKNGNKPQRKIVTINFGFSWLYIPLIIGILYLMFTSGSAKPMKIEWADVKEMIQAGDVKDIVYIRNDYKGDVTIRPDRLAKYSDKFGGKVPSSSPHFWFYVSGKFDPVRTPG